MKTVGKRINEFVDYHINGDGECNNVVLKEWAWLNCVTKQELYELSFFFAVTYCVESSIVLFRNREEVWKDVLNWSKQNKKNIIFQSDRKYMRMRDSFERCLLSFNRDLHGFIEKTSENGVLVLEKAIPYVSSWEMFGRFSAFLFLETFVALTGMPIENYTIEWKKGNTATSGLMNVYGMDEAANAFDKTGRLLLSEKTMDKMLLSLLNEIDKSGGSTNVTEVETSLCAYRKFYKGSRYNGFYLDRMLEEIYSMQSKYPDISRELLDIRAREFKKKYLGELCGWRGIRKAMKKVYKETGMIT